MFKNPRYIFLKCFPQGAEGAQKLSYSIPLFSFSQILSQYIETNVGSQPKALELYNNTGSTIYLGNTSSGTGHPDAYIYITGPFTHSVHDDGSGEEGGGGGDVGGKGVCGEGGGKPA